MKKGILVLLIALSLFGVNTFAQTIYKFGTNGGPSGSGTTLAATSDLSSKTVTFTDASTNALTGVTASIFLNAQQYGPGTIQGVPEASGIFFGNSNSTSSDNNFISVPYYRGMNSVSNATNAMFTGCNTCTGGIDVAADQAISLATTTEGFINNTGDNLKATNDRIYMGNLVINFNVPVSNPILNFVGLGGDNEWQENINHKDYILGFSTEFDLATTTVSLSKKSGNAAFAVTSTSITNSAPAIGFNSVGGTIYADPVTRYAASGSVLVSGTNITSIIFFVYLKGDGGRIVNQNNGSVTTANLPFHLAWAASNHATANPYSKATISADAFMLNISFQKPVNVRGTVFNDPNGGNVNNSSGTTNAVPSGMYINLIDANNKVVASATVNSDGTYSFTNIGEGNYTTILSSSNLAQGVAKTAATTPSGWVNTGEFNGTPNTGNDGLADGNSSVFTVGSTDVNNINFGIKPASGLPLKLISFSANRLSDCTITLNWQTANEINVKHFEIQQSINGIDFEAKGTINAKNYLSSSTYQFLDKTAKGGANYYRLKQVNNDGKFEYSNILVIKNNCENNSNYSIAPTISKTGNFIITGLQGGELLRVIDNIGRVISVNKLTGNSIDLSKLQKGLYHLQIIDSKETTTVFKVMLQ